MPLEERPVVVAREEARFLAVGAAGGREPCALGLRARFLLRLVAEWKPEPIEEARIEPREHVRLVLAVVDRAREQETVAAPDDASVVPGRETRGAGTLGEREQLRETEAAVACDAGVRRLTARIATDERPDDRAAELLAQVEGDVRQAALVAGRARCNHGAGRAAGALAVGPCRIHPEPQRDAERMTSRPQESDRAVDAAAHRDCDAIGMRLRAKDLCERIRERVDGKRLAADRRSLDQRQSFNVARESRRVGGDDAVALDVEAREREFVAARRVSDDLDHAASVAA